MTDTILKLPDDSSNTGKLVDESQLTVGANTVIRQRVVIADPTNASGLATVDATDGLSVNLTGAGGTNFAAEPKGTQAANFLPVQAAADTGRTYIVLHADNVAGVTAEAVFTFTKNVGGTETTGQTSYTVTTGKTLRLQSLSILVKDTTTTANSIQVKLRSAASAVSVTSPVVAALFASAPAAVASAIGAAAVNWDGGIEVASGNQIAISHLENVTTAAISSFCLTGFEY